MNDTNYNCDNGAFDQILSSSIECDSSSYELKHCILERYQREWGYICVFLPMSVGSIVSLTIW